MSAKEVYQEPKVQEKKRIENEPLEVLLDIVVGLQGAGQQEEKTLTQNILTSKKIKIRKV
jgi:hypothetical protein